MRATDVLKAEHRVIEQVLSCLEKLSSLAAESGRLEADAARDIVDFLRQFADRCHHGKEEAHLFPMMEARGFPRDGGPTGVMLSEHEQGREHVRAMAANIDAAAQGQPEALQRFTRHAQAFVRLLREHIQKEDHCLFTMADQAFDAQEQQTLLERFEHVERHEIGEETHERYLKLADRLADKFGVPRAATAGAPSCCGHHHRHLSETKAS